MRYDERHYRPRSKRVRQLERYRADGSSGTDRRPLSVSRGVENLDPLFRSRSDFSTEIVETPQIPERVLGVSRTLKTQRSAGSIRKSLCG
ncbi:hypothetical protein CKA32_007078 [Geitlerinema sp. FC II]|nr:hypothetical protein CKA32_007078 [Geitlerinema sp. FC II]